MLCVDCSTGFNKSSFTHKIINNKSKKDQIIGKERLIERKEYQLVF